MCGIQVLVALSEPLPTPRDVATTGTDVDTCSEMWVRLTAANSRRGPDAHSEMISLYPLACVKLGAHVLHLRGPHTQTQPIVAEDTGDIFCWNGEVFSGLDIGNSNDGAVLLENIQQIKLQHPTDYILRMFSTIEGPYAFVYLDHSQQKLWFARDYLGRRSLLTKTINNRTLLISSVADVGCKEEPSDTSGWFELPAQRIYCLDLANLRQTEHEMVPLGPVVEYKWHYGNLNSCTYSEDSTKKADDLLVLPFDRVSQDIGNDLANTDIHDPRNGEMADLINNPKWVPFIDRLEHELTNAIKVRVESIPSNGLDSRVGVLFSGGVDCITIAALLTTILPRSEPIELFNVAFENPRQLKLQTNENAYNVPDRKTGRQGWEELCNIDPTREWRFVEVDVPYSQVLEYRSHIRQLLIPSDTVMDMSIGMAIWFASRGIGNLISNIQKQKENQLQTEYIGRSRVLLLGMGADEQLGGYSRHRSAWDRGKWQALGQEIELDVSRIATRNLGRDDRIISDNAKEARFPFLAANVVRFLSEIPLGRKMDMRYPRGMGEKLLLRLLAYRLGLVQASTLAKRAIQFGARTAKMESNQSKGHDTL
ncbi:hypothetical protein COEREDRAFT_15801 [Coemansia reversa NRRL 1564]|uniref:Glutamine amidotransferase type-2 domain-containing protein n=1 Tax=Coemansia reversa (strain ATCC 12441 / NRRL 1564) TaxID=763665 RepID=A0A2G5BAE3_COERN|nr:hypothetical protein COEREDRAFT_15801 [Coemansia reversa NRRL 1564]|eukprot:PIA15962.1 hypothetical protein COEREDRAFT_15801 [Coemansia reversa NRRL 1564]